MATFTMLGAPNGVYYVNNNSYTAAASGLISNVASNDLAGLMASGCTIISGRRNAMVYYGAVKAANATVISASAALSAGLSIAAQPDVPRPVQGVIFPGTAAITAGAVAITYLDEIGITRTDNQTCICPTTTPFTFVTSHGVSGSLVATASGVTGGVTPAIQLGTNANIALATDEGAQGLAVYKAIVDSADDTIPVIVGGNIITPHTAPNGTHTFGFGFSFYSD